MKIAGTRFSALPYPESIHVLPIRIFFDDLRYLRHSWSVLKPGSQLIQCRFLAAREHFNISIAEVDCMAGYAQRFRHFAGAVTKPNALDTAFNRESART